MSIWGKRADAWVNKKTGTRSKAEGERTAPRVNATVGDTGIRTSGVLAIIGGLLIVVGSFMPWIQAQAFIASVSRSGMDGGDGVITLLLGVLVLVTGVGWATSQSRKVSWAAPLIPGGITLVVALMNMSDVSDRVAEFERTAQGMGSASVGAGLWVVLGGAVLAIWSSFSDKANPPALIAEEPAP